MLGAMSTPPVSALSVASLGSLGLSFWSLLWFHLSQVSRNFPLVSALSVSSRASLPVSALISPL